MRRGMSLVAVLGVGFVLAGFGRSDVPPKTETTTPPPKSSDVKLPTKKDLMAAKLKHSQTMLAGIALNDFAQLAAEADELVLVTKATDFLNAYKGPEYQFHLTTFRRAAEAVGKKARDKNMDGVMVAYNDLTLSCLKCHQGMRDKEFDAAVPSPKGNATIGN